MVLDDDILLWAILDMYLTLMLLIDLVEVGNAIILMGFESIVPRALSGLTRTHLSLRRPI